MANNFQILTRERSLQRMLLEVFGDFDASSARDCFRRWTRA
ncbi:hypothetical protein [Desulfosarcina widdelii]|nr:hypothetical protein [Desulfosarcina widdelii]